MNTNKPLNEVSVLLVTPGEASSSFRNEERVGFFDQMRKEYAPSIEDSPSIDTVKSSTPYRVADSTVDQGSSLSTIEEITEEYLLNAPSHERMGSASDDLPPKARRALVSLFRQGVILYSQKARLFELICQYQAPIRRHLAEVFLKLVLDEKMGIAFVASIQNEENAEQDDFDDEETVSLITKRTLTLYDTLLLLVLRKHYQDRETSGEQKITFDLERVESYLTPFLPLTNSTKSDRRQLDPALKRMVEKKVLRKIPGNDDRYEITPVIRYVVNAEFLESMLDEYLKLANESGIELSGSQYELENMNGDHNV